MHKPPNYILKEIHFKSYILKANKYFDDLKVEVFQIILSKRRFFCEELSKLNIYLSQKNFNLKNILRKIKDIMIYR